MLERNMIEVEQLRKQYGDFTAVKDVTFTAQPGEIFGLLGPNGAGKTTTIGCISSLLTPTAGHIRVMGHDVVRDGVAARRSIGVVPQEIALYDDLSARENLELLGRRARPSRRATPRPHHAKCWSSLGFSTAPKNRSNDSAAE